MESPRSADTSAPKRIPRWVGKLADQVRHDPACTEGSDIDLFLKQGRVSSNPAIVNEVLSWLLIHAKAKDVVDRYVRRIPVGLVELDLVGNPHTIHALTAEFLKEIFEQLVLTNRSRIVTVSFKGFWLDGASVLAISDMLARSSTITSFCILNCRLVRPADAEELFLRVPALHPSLRSLAISQLDIDIGCANAIAKMVRGNYLTELRLIETTLLIKPAQAIGSALANNTGLRSLAFTNMRIDLEQSGIAAALMTCPSLVQLSLNDCNLQAHNEAAIDALVAGHPALKVLRLRDNPSLFTRRTEPIFSRHALTRIDLSRSIGRTNGRLAHFFKSLCVEVSPLTHLRIAGVELDDAAKDALIELTSTNRSLKHLDLSNVALGKETWPAIWKMLASRDCALSELRVANCGIAKIPAGSLAQNKSLELIDLSGNRLGAGAVLEIGALLASSDKLKHLYLNNCALDNGASKCLLQSYQKSRKLRALDISANHISSSNICAWLKEVAALNGLHSFRMHQLLLSDAPSSKHPISAHMRPKVLDVLDTVLVTNDTLIDIDLEQFQSVSNYVKRNASIASRLQRNAYSGSRRIQAYFDEVMMRFGQSLPQLAHESGLGLFIWKWLSDPRLGGGGTASLRTAVIVSSLSRFMRGEHPDALRLEGKPATRRDKGNPSFERDAHPQSTDGRRGLEAQLGAQQGRIAPDDR